MDKKEEKQGESGVLGKVDLVGEGLETPKTEIENSEKEASKEFGTKKIKNWHRLGAKTKLQKSWIWNKSVEDFVKSRIHGTVLNVCAGKSPLGDIKIDLDPTGPEIIKGDFRKLPFEDNSFDCVIEDPPWKIGYYQRMVPFFECVRVCKVGGTIIYNAYWIPESRAVELIETTIRQDMPWSNTSIISIFKKTREVLSEEKRYNEVKK